MHSSKDERKGTLMRGIVCLNSTEEEKELLRSRC